MVSSMSAIIAIAASAGMLQMCPAPPAIVGGIVGGVAAGAIGGGATICARYCPGPEKRSAGIFARQLPPGVSQESLDQCTAQINDQAATGGSVQISDVSEGCESAS